jgi:hypothetical protein
MNTVVAGNLSETLFNQNEKLIKQSKNTPQGFSNNNLSGLQFGMDSDMDKQMPAYLSQSHLSTWYQNNPWEILTSSQKYGLPIMGGELTKDQGPGNQPGNVLRQPASNISSAPRRKPSRALESPTDSAPTQAPTPASALEDKAEDWLTKLPLGWKIIIGIFFSLFALFVIYVMMGGGTRAE